MNAEEDRLRFDLSQSMNWDDFERTMREIHAILGDIAGFVPFANPQSGKPREKHEIQSSNGKSKHTYYDYYD